VTGRRSAPLPELREHLLVGREPVRLVLGVDQIAVHGHVEDAAVAALQVSGDAELALDRGLQTGGLGRVVSFQAIRDLDLHRLTPSGARVVGLAPIP
jgi:hypothetical protein